MRVSCPACSAAYEVPDRLIGTGRALRCARCGHNWTVRPASAEVAPASEGPLARALAEAPTSSLLAELAREAAAEAPPPPAPGPAPAPAPAAAAPASPTPATAGAAPAPTPAEKPPVSTPPPDRRLAVAWVATLAAVVLVLGALYAFRSEVMAAWPPSARAYIALGLAEPD